MQDFTQTERWFPTALRMTRVGRHTVAVLEYGHGAPLLLLHAAPTWSFIYREFLTELAPHFRCIAVDFPGFGLSPEPEGAEPTLPELSRLVEELIVQFNLRDLTLLMHDSAGSIGIGAAGRLPERIRGLILTDTFAWPLRTDFPKIRFMLRLVTSLPFSLLQTRFNLLPWAAIMTAGGRSITKEERKAFLAGFHTTARRARVLHFFRGLLRENAFLEKVEDNLRQHLATKPSLVMFGEKDPARKVGFEERWRQVLKNGTFHVLPHQMHFPHFGAAKQMCRHIVAWVECLSDNGPRREKVMDPASSARRLAS